MIPDKLKKGDEIRVIAPSRSLQIMEENPVKIATQKLEQMGFKVTFGRNVNQVMYKDYMCASIQERLEDLQEAFADKNVKAILTVIGGLM